MIDKLKAYRDKLLREYQLREATSIVPVMQPIPPAKVVVDLVKYKEGEIGPKGEKGDRGETGPVPTKNEVVELLLPHIPDPIVGPPGKDGVDGKDADEEAIKASVLASIPAPKDGLNGLNGQDGVDGKDGLPGKDGSPDSGEQIIDKINDVDTDGPKIDAVHIKNLPVAINKTITKMGGGSGPGATNLNALTDVNLSSPTNGQVLSYNSSTGQWSNAADVAGTPAGSDTQVQFNNAGAFGASANLRYYDYAGFGNKSLVSNDYATTDTGGTGFIAAWASNSFNGAVSLSYADGLQWNATASPKYLSLPKLVGSQTGAVGTWLQIQGTADGGTDEGVRIPGTIIIGSDQIPTVALEVIGTIKLGTYGGSQMSMTGTTGLTLSGQSGQSTITSGLIVNNASGSTAADIFIVKGSADSNLINTSAANSTVGFGIAAPAGSTSKSKFGGGSSTVAAINIANQTAKSSPVAGDMWTTTSGLFYSTSTAAQRVMAVADVGATNRALLSGNNANPAWSSATYPASTTVSQILYSSGTNTITGLATANNGLLVTSATGVPSILAGPGTTGNILQSNAAAAPSFSTATYPSTTTVSQILYSSSANVVAGLATANNALLVTSGTGVPSISATIPLGITFTAATTADQSFNVPAGTAPTSPVDGDHWNDSTQKCMTNFVDGIKQYDWRTIFVATADGATATGDLTTEQTVTPTGVGTLILPSNFFLAGKVLRISITFAQAQNGSFTPAPTIKIKKGSTVIAQAAYSWANNSGTTISGMIPIVGTSTTATKARAKLIYGATAASSVNIGTDATISTNSEAISVTVTFAAATHSADSLTVTQMLVEVGL